MIEAPDPILVVDDESIVRRMVVDVLAAAGITAFGVESGEVALETLKERRVRMVITDNNMPGIQGLDLLQQIRASYGDLPVILMTAYGRVETSIKAHDLGADGFLLKPFDDINVIIEEVEAVLARVARRRATPAPGGSGSG